MYKFLLLWLCPGELLQSVPDSFVPTLATVCIILALEGLGHPSSPSELFEVCFPSGACQPLSLKQFTNQSVNSQLRGTLGKVLHLLWHLLLLFHCFLKHEGGSHKREQICYLVLPPFMCLQSRQRKHLLMSGRQTLTRWKGLFLVLVHFPRAECVAGFRVLKSATTRGKISCISVPLSGNLLCFKERMASLKKLKYFLRRHCLTAEQIEHLPKFSFCQQNYWDTAISLTASAYWLCQEILD